MTHRLNPIMSTPPPPPAKLPPGLPADCYALGDPTAVFEPDRGQGCMQHAVWGFLLLFGLCSLACGGIIKFAPEEHGRSNTPMALILVAIAAPFLVLGAYKLVQQRRQIGQTVWLCPGGVVSVRGRDAAAFPWDSIDAVWRQVTDVFLNGRHARTDYVYTVRRADGATRVFNWNLRDVQSLGDKVIAEAGRRRLAKAVEVLGGGGKVAFGPLALSPDTLTYGEKVVPLADVTTAAMEAGYVVVRHGGGRPGEFKVRSADVPNVDVFLTLAGALLKR